VVFTAGVLEDPVGHSEVRTRIQALTSESAGDPKCPADAGDFV